MIIIQNALVSETILEKKFACQLNACKGACCVEGDAGAPLDETEIAIIADEIENIKPFMRADGIALLKEKGFHEMDVEGEIGTVCSATGECVFVNFRNNIAVCAIEDAFHAGKTWFRKPLSCHLYPIRAKKYGDYIALNYHTWNICNPACTAGEEMQMPVHRFLRDALVRKFGPSWYAELEEVADAWNDKKITK